MRQALIQRVVPLAMIAAAALALASCGSHDDANNSSGSDKAASSGASDDPSSNSQFVNADLGDNEMDANDAQVDTANSTIVPSKPGAAAPGNATQRSPTAR